MFGHTFLRINSSYHSRLLSYAINYAADADPKKENGVIFAIKGLFGGYAGKYSLLPYYDKLKEYRDTENRDIWEYDLNLSREETIRMLEHIWEIKNTKASYYFFTDNCAYEMLWPIEIARPSLHLRERFRLYVIPLETVHAAKEENLILATNYRPSKRSKIEAYKDILTYKQIQLAKAIAAGEENPENILKQNLNKDTKRHLLEVAIELTQYYYQSNKLTKDHYLDIFHQLTSIRATLGRTKKVTPKEPPNPLEGHRAARISFGLGVLDSDALLEFSIAPAYHNLTDPLYGFLRGTQIEFLNLDGYLTTKDAFLKNATILSLESIAQIDSFFNNFSWRMYLGWDRDFYDTKSRFDFSIGAGYSLGNRLGYIYAFADPHLHYTHKVLTAIDVSGGFVIDKFSKYTQTKLEYKHKWYESNKKQQIVSFAQTFRLKQNIAFILKYEYHDRLNDNEKKGENYYLLQGSYYF